MKNFPSRLYAFLGFMLCTPFLFSQTEIDLDKTGTSKPTPHFFNEDKGYKTIGLDLGFSYQSSDVRSLLKGWGIGLTYEKNLSHRKNGLLDFGLRGRAHYANSYGQDAKQAGGIFNNPAVNGTYNPVLNYNADKFYYANFRNEMAELAAEGIVTFNRMRERRGVYLALFGGVGADWHKVSIDQLGADGKKYNYAAVTTPSVSNLRDLRDGKFETPADGFQDSAIISLMPRVGIELGVHIKPRFMITLMHKLTFTGSDQFDGQRWTNNNTLTADKDLHHYTAVQLKWIIGDEPIRDTELPQVQITRPAVSPYTSIERIETLRAKIRGTASANDVRVTVNGVPNRFTLFREDLVAELSLQRGENVVIVTVTNAFGSDSKQVIINVRERDRPTTDPVIITGSAPRIRFENPSTSYYETENTRTPISVRIDNIANAQDLSLSVNGREERNFRFAGNELNATLDLVEGENRIVVSARNASGSATEGVTINSRRRSRLDFPTVRITSTGNPSENSFGGCQTTIEARIEYVNSRQGIQMTVNGRAYNDYAFDANAKILRGVVNLADGENTVEIRVKNEGGNASDRAIVPCQVRRQTAQPIVKIDAPYQSQNFEIRSVDLRAQVQNLNDRNQIDIQLNGYRVYDFTLTNGIIAARLNAAAGENLLRIKATNTDGTSEDQVRFTVRERVVVQAPRITILSPNNGATIGEGKTILEARIEQVTNRNNVSVLVNGSSFSNFDYDVNSGLLRAGISLRDGQNTLTVRANTEGGRDEQSVSVRKLGAVELPQPPRISIQQPNNGFTTQNPVVDFRASVTAIQDRNQIRLYLNGQEVNAFAFDANRRQISAQLTAQEGQNTIRLTASNKDGSDEASTAFTFTKPVVILPPRPPRVTISNPVDGSTIENSAITLEAMFENVAQKSQIQVLLNGNSIPFSLNLLRQLRTRVDLPEGENSLTVRATNKDGVDEKTVRIRYAKATDPNPKKGDTGNVPSRTDTPSDGKAGITNFNTTQPVTDPFDPKPLVSVMTATVRNMPQASVQLLVNDVAVINFEYNAETGQIRYSFPVKSGQSYTFFIRAYDLQNDVNLTQTVKY